MSDIYHQLVVVGGGLAGLRAAIGAHDNGLDVAVLSQVYPIRSHSGAAQGGMNAALGNAEEGKDDTTDRHAYDTIKGSDFLADQDAVEVLTREAPEVVFEMEHWGVPFSRTRDGRIAQRPFGGGGFPRTCYAADKTGRFLLHTMYEQTLKRGIKVYPEEVVLALVEEGGACQGVIAYHLPTGRLKTFQAEAVLFGTGGYGQIYAHSTNSLVNAGSGMAVAYCAGVSLEDMEFVQFHPTSLIGTNILMTEAARGEGGYLVNNKGERFMKNYAPSAMELAPRDIVARSIRTEIMEGRGFDNSYVYLDLRHLGKEKILERLPEIRDHAIHFVGVDPIRDPIPIQPGQHYSMGGIACNCDGETEIKGFYAAGECACVSVHGANRLGGNSLLDTIVFGRRAGNSIPGYVKGKGNHREGGKALQAAMERVRQSLNVLLQGTGSEEPSKLRVELKETMFDQVGIFRDASAMGEGLSKVKELQDRYTHIRPLAPVKGFNLDLVRGYELQGMLDLAEIITKGALAREESRGSHYRTDFRQRDDQHWLKHTLAHYTKDGPELSYKPVTTTRWLPEIRKY